MALRAGQPRARRHEHIAKNVNSLSGNHPLDCMQLSAGPQEFDHQGDSNKADQPKHDRCGGTPELEWTQLDLNRSCCNPKNKHNKQGSECCHRKADDCGKVLLRSGKPTLIFEASPEDERES